MAAAAVDGVALDERAEGRHVGLVDVEQHPLVGDAEDAARAQLEARLKRRLQLGHHVALERRVEREERLGLHRVLRLRRHADAAVAVGLRLEPLLRLGAEERDGRDARRRPRRRERERRQTRRRHALEEARLRAHVLDHRQLAVSQRERDAYLQVLDQRRRREELHELGLELHERAVVKVEDDEIRPVAQRLPQSRECILGDADAVDVFKSANREGLVIVACCAVVLHHDVLLVHRRVLEADCRCDDDRRDADDEQDAGDGERARHLAEELGRADHATERLDQLLLRHLAVAVLVGPHQNVDCVALQLLLRRAQLAILVVVSPSESTDVQDCPRTLLAAMTVSILAGLLFGHAKTSEADVFAGRRLPSRLFASIYRILCVSILLLVWICSLGERCRIW
mmetsp:Transcript_4603/g.9066  ORF Transcript_4603/g.9066 Transcript_4603/m.9066 type:complete len:398 (+) Transcript_4603:3024-4217(+)